MEISRRIRRGLQRILMYRNRYTHVKILYRDMPTFGLNFILGGEKYHRRCGNALGEISRIRESMTSTGGTTL